MSSEQQHAAVADWIGRMDLEHYEKLHLLLQTTPRSNSLSRRSSLKTRYTYFKSYAENSSSRKMSRQARRL